MPRLSCPNLVLMTCLLLLGSAELCRATTFTFDTTVTLNASDIGTSGGAADYVQFFSGLPAFTVQAGDVITGTISFGSSVLTIQNPVDDSPYAVFLEFIASTGNPSTTDLASVKVLGLSGQLGTTNPTPNASESARGLLLAGFNNNSLASNFSFTGLTYTIAVESVTKGNSSKQTSGAFAFSEINIAANRITLSSTATPEPAAFALCGIGCMILALIRKRTKHSNS